MKHYTSYFKHDLTEPWLFQDGVTNSLFQLKAKCSYTSKVVFDSKCRVEVNNKEGWIDIIKMDSDTQTFIFDPDSVWFEVHLDFIICYFDSEKTKYKFFEFMKKMKNISSKKN